MPIPKLPKTDVRLATSVSFFVLREDTISPFTIFQGGRSELNDIQGRMIRILALTSFIETQERSTMSRWELDSDLRGETVEVFQQPADRTITLRRAVLYDTDMITAFGYAGGISPDGKRSGGNQGRGTGPNIPPGLLTRDEGDDDTGRDASILIQQPEKAFILIRREVSPEGSQLPTIITLYRGCIFSRLVRTYDLKNQDLAVLEDAAIKYSSRQQIRI